MKLRGKIAWLLLVIVALYAMLDFAIQRLVILPSFLELERIEAGNNLQRGVEAIRTEVEHLNLFTMDWSMWDDSYRFVQDRNDAFIQANLGESTFQMAKINLFLFYNDQGVLVWGRFLDLAAAEERPFADLPAQAADHPLLRTRERQSGLMMTGAGPMLLAVHPILTSQQGGPSRGVLVTGRLLTDELVQRLLAQTHVEFKLLPVDGERARAVGARLGPQAGATLIEVEPGRVAGYALLRDLRQQPILLIEATTPREISRRGEQTLRLALGSVLLIAALLLATLILALTRLVVRPLAQLTEHAVAVGRGHDYTLRLATTRRDEIGLLGDELDAMVARLGDSHHRLAEQSYLAGMAIQSAATLHNIRNALMAITVPIEQAGERLRRLPLEDTDRALAELGGGTPPPDRRADLQRFVLLGTHQWLAQARELQSALATVAERLHLLEGLLQRQHRTLGAVPPVETFSLSELVHEARQLAGVDQQPVTLQVGEELLNLPHLHLPRVVVVQVLSNLLVNALEAMQRQPGVSGRITLHARLAPEGGGVELQVQDNGVGIASEALPHLFERQFSSKEGGGLGLHWCANVLIPLRGRLQATSPGPGQGACLHLFLPLEMPP